MVDNLTLRRTYDEEEIRAILSDPDIYERITSDENKEIQIPLTRDFFYLIGEVSGTPIGLAILHPYKDGFEAHYQVLPEYRKSHAVQFAQKGLEMFRGHRVYGLVPEYYPNVIAFDKKIGFEHIDTIPNDFKKDGQLYFKFKAAKEREEAMRRKKEEEEKIAKYSIFYRLFAYVSDKKLLFALGILIAVLNGLLFPFFSIFLARMLAILVEFANNPAQSRTDSNNFSLYFLLFGIASFFLNLFQMAIFSYIGEDLTEKIRN